MFSLKNGIYVILKSGLFQTSKQMLHLLHADCTAAFKNSSANRSRSRKETCQ